MSVISNFMKRLGWVRLSSYGLELGPDGKLVSASEFASPTGLDVGWSEVPEVVIDPASCFDPSLAKLAAGSMETRAVGAAEQDVDAGAWLAAVAKAKAQSEAHEQAAQAAQETSEEADTQVENPEAQTEEDWEAVMLAARQRAEDAQSQSGEVADTETEDWDALMMAARQRAETKEAPMPLPLPPAPAVAAEVDPAAAQVEQGTPAANDDRPAVRLTSIPSASVPAVPVSAASVPAASVPAVPVSAASDTEEEAEWKKLRAAVESRDQAENERKMRAMREIERLRKSRNTIRNVPSLAPKRRMAAGTAAPPRTGAPQQRAIVIAPGPVPAPADSSMVTAPTATLPRITRRLTNKN